jgi:allophanate hydrolase
MIASLKVIRPGLHSTFQDGGRIGHRDIGVPCSGPLDRVSLRLANALVGNRAGTPALELLISGPCMQVQTESVRIALAGCHASLDITEPGGGRRQVAAGQSTRLGYGDTFRVDSLGESLCAYLAIQGGAAMPRVLGSASTYVRGGFGGHLGRRLQANDVLPLRLAAVPEDGDSRLAGVQDLGMDQVIRVVPGPQQELFTQEAMDALLSSTYTVSQRSDRMGFRLDGPLLAHAGDYNIVSDGTVPGAIQVPGSGQPIILMADSQTTGGYPKIATVISADLPVVGRRKPGHKLRFEAVEVARAEALRREQELALEREAGSIIRAIHA